jgi:hypothetical protein
MINAKEQLNKIKDEQLKAMNAYLSDIDDGEQKEYFKSVIDRLKSGENIDPMNFVEGLGAIKGAPVDTNKLKEVINGYGDISKG